MNKENWKCNECESSIYPTWNLESCKEMGIEPSVPDICDECIKTGWVEVTDENAQEITDELSGALTLEHNRQELYKQQKDRNL